MRSLPNRNPDRARTFRPMLEALEGRWCPSAIITAIPHTLLVLGDSGANAVQITDQGNGTVTASVDAVGPVTRSDIYYILVLTGGGNDTVNYGLTGDLTSPRLLSVNLGALADTSANTNSVALDFGGHAINSLLGVVVAGTAGQDTVTTANFTGDIKGAVGIGVYAGGGADTISVGYQGTLTGKLGLLLDGGAGADTVSAGVTLNSGSTGYLGVAVLGAGGDDKLTLQVFDNSGGLADVFAVLDGGPGTDTCTVTSNVLVFNCEP
jgi:hypothetical protein